MSEKWEEIGAAKRKALLNAIPQQWRIADEAKPSDDVLDVIQFAETSNYFSSDALKITNSTATELVADLASGCLTSVQVTSAFCHRAAAAHQLTQCLSEILFEEALDRAKTLDDHFAKTGQPIGPLHGLPISIKDNFNIKGVDSTIGFTSWVNDPATYNATLIDMLLRAGAVLYCKTNVPTAMMIAESVNNTFGRTVNPLNRSLTSGGSSGGESALIAFRGSVLGVGTDIGGSLRIPAACCGLFTLRPSFGRFPTLNCRSALAGQEAVQSVNGPIAHTISDLELFSRVVVNAEPWLQDPRCVPIPWRMTEQRKSNLRIGVMWNDGIVCPTPPVQRGLKITVEALKAAGHEIVEWAPTGHQEGLTVLQKFFLADGGQSIKQLLKVTNEPIRPEMAGYANAANMNVFDLWQTQGERVAIQKSYLDRWIDAGIDCILCPTTPYASVTNGDFKYVGYTGIYNILDYAATSFPCGVRADQALDVWDSNETGWNDMDSSVRSTYNAAAVHGMPVSLQLVARRFEEEKALMMTEIILEALQTAVRE